MSKKKVIVLAIIFGLLILAFAAKTIFFKNKFNYAGTVEVTKVDIPARVQSVIATLAAKEGDWVKKGQVVVVLSCEDLKIGNDLAQSNYHRSRALYSSGNISAEAYDQVRAKKADLELRTRWCEVSSPLSGIVLTKYFEEGEMVNPGAKLLTVANLADVYAYFFLPHDEIAALKTGQKIEATLPELKDQKFPGVIEFINPEAEFTPKNVQTRDERTRLVYGVKIRFDNPDGVLKPGMTLEWNSGD
ncbi:MAG: efflux RND transporter periplasmic adaptor subunit [Bdellovibrio sp.]